MAGTLPDLVARLRIDTTGLAMAVGEAKAASAEMGAGFEADATRVEGAVGQAAASFGGLGAGARTAGGDLNEAGAATRGAEVAARDAAASTSGLKGALTDAGVAAGAMGGSFRESFTGMGENTRANSLLISGTLVGAVGLAAGAAVEMGSKFNSAMEMVHTQAGAAQSEVDGLKNKVLELAGQVGQSPEHLAEGLYHIESAGFRGAQALDILKAAAMGAAIGNANLEDVSQAMIGVMASGIGGVRDAQDAMATLNEIVGIGDMRMEKLSASIATGVLPTFKTAGLTIQDYGAALATLTDNVTPADEAATRLRMTISLMEAPSQKAQGALAKIGISSTELATDMRQPNGLMVAVDDLKKHLEGAGLSAVQQAAVIQEAFGGGRTSGAIQTLLQESDRLRSKYDELGTAAQREAAFQEAWRKTQDTFKQSMADFRGEIDAVATRIGLALLPILTTMAQWFTNALGWITQHRVVWESLALVIGTAFTGALIVATHALVAFIAPFVAAAAPFLAAAAAIGAIGAAVVLAYQHFAPFHDVVDGIASALSGVFTTAIGIAKNVWDGLSDALKAVSPVWTAIAGAVEKVAPDIGTALVGALNGLKTALDTVLGPIGSVFGWLTDPKNRDAVTALAAVLTANLIPALVRIGITAGVSAAQSAVLWTMYKVDAVVAAARFAASSALIVASWVAQATSANLSALRIAGAWVLSTGAAAAGAVAGTASAAASVVAGWVSMAAGAVAQGARVAVAWAASAAETTATWIGMAAQAGFNAVLVVNSWAVTASAAIRYAVMHPIAAAQVIGSWVAMAVESMVNAVKVAAAWIVSTAQAAPAAIASTVAAVGSIIASWVTMAVESMANAVKTAAAWVVSSGDAATGAIASTAGAVATIIASWVSMAVESMVNAVKTAAAWALSSGEALIAAVAATAGAVIAVVGGWAAMAAAAMADAIVMATAWLISIAPIALVILAVTGLAFLIYKNWGDIKQWTQDAWNAVSGFVRRAWDDISGAVWGGIQAVVRFVSGLPGQVMGFFSNAWNWLKQAGSDIMHGLEQGLKDAGHFVLDAVKTVIGGIPLIGPQLLKMFSPSRVMMDQGRNIAAGLALGITAGTEQVTAAATAMNTAAVAAASKTPITVPLGIGTAGAGLGASAAGGGASTSKTYNAHITSTADPNAIAAETLRTWRTMEAVYG